MRSAIRAFLAVLLGYLVTSIVACIVLVIYVGPTPAAPILGVLLPMFPVVPAFLVKLLEGAQRWWFVVLAAVFIAATFLSWRWLDRKRDDV
jgi:hypothetical protein